MVILFCLRLSIVVIAASMVLSASVLLLDMCSDTLVCAGLASMSLSLFLNVCSYVCLPRCFYLCSDIPCFRVLLRAFACARVSCLLVYARMFVFVGMSLHDVIVCSFYDRLVTS